MKQTFQDGVQTTTWTKLNSTVSYRKTGNIVELVVLLNGDFEVRNTGHDLGTLPVGLRPITTISVLFGGFARNADYPPTLYVRPDGNITISANSTEVVRSDGYMCFVAG